MSHRPEPESLTHRNVNSQGAYKYYTFGHIKRNAVGRPLSLSRQCWLSGSKFSDLHFQFFAIRHFHAWSFRWYYIWFYKRSVVLVFIFSEVGFCFYFETIHFQFCSLSFFQFFLMCILSTICMIPCVFCMVFRRVLRASPV